MDGEAPFNDGVCEWRNARCGMDNDLKAEDEVARVLLMRQQSLLVPEHLEQVPWYGGSDLRVPRHFFLVLHNSFVFARVPRNLHIGIVTCAERRGHAEGLDVGRDVRHGGHKAVI